MLLRASSESLTSIRVESSETDDLKSDSDPPAMSFELIVRGGSGIWVGLISGKPRTGRSAEHSADSMYLHD